jgi:hypothetical protein
MRAIPASCASRSCRALHFIVLITITTTLMFVASMRAQNAASLTTTSRPLITQTVDETRLTRLNVNTHQLARPEFDLGTASASLPLQRMLLVLKRSPEQEHGLRTLLDEQQDKASPNFHKWLTPEQYGRQFGPSDSDLQTITSWLQSHGFQVGTTKGRTVLEFSGTAGQVQEAFHTTMHKYIVKGQQHWANANDPMIPTALTPAVEGVLTLHNFIKQPQIHLSKGPVAAKLSSGKKRSQITFSDGTHGLGPFDFATIYNSSAFIDNINGAGVTIAVVGRTNLYNGGQDLSDFDSSVFACCGPNFEIVLNGPDPGDLGGGEEAEATLDMTWSGAVAPAAHTDLVVSATTNTTDGVDLSEVYIIENNLAGIMTESFGSCEATTSDAAGISSLAEQAAAQGITYLVSSGDSGAEGCDNPNTELVASGPVSVNALASTNFNVAVGGTMFNENGQDSLYWDTANTNNVSALSYIPENVWNESCTNCSGAGIWAGGGGVSRFSTSKPAWQLGVTGVPQDNARDLPDVSLTAASHDGYIVCLEGSCVPDSTGNLFVYLISGTSASTPAFAGIMALIEQQNGRQGQANYVLYRLAAAGNSTLAQCDASSTLAFPDTTCVFNDVTVGNIAVPGEVNYGLTTAQYQSGAGYDMATGLGSVNIHNLVNQWNSVTFNATTTTLGIDPVVNITHGTPVSVAIAVTATDGGTPTGNVSLMGNFVLGQSLIQGFPLANGLVAQPTSQLPGGGPYDVTAHYSGDGTYAPSDSTSVLVTVTPESSTTTVSVLTTNSQGILVPFSGGAFGSFVYLRADVAGQSGFGLPTGSVTFLDGSSPVVGGSSLVLNSQGNTATPNGIYTFDTGTHTVTASYSGDSSFTASTSSQSQSFTITPGFFAEIPSAQSTVLISAPGGSGSTSISVTNSSGFSGTISLACSGLPSEATCVFAPTTIKPSGTANTTSASITVTTKAPTALAHSQQQPNWRPGKWMIGMGLLFSSILIGGKRQRARGLFLLLILALVVVAPGCGGGGSHASQAPPPDAGTPAGVSTIFVTATSGSMVITNSFTLVVQ